MEILIDKGYGEIRFSSFAVIEWLKKTGIPVWFYMDEKTNVTYVDGHSVFSATYKKITEEEALNKNISIISISTKDYGDIVDDYLRLVQKENTEIKINHHQFRDDPTMIELFKKYGTIKMSSLGSTIALETIEKGKIVRLENENGREKLRTIYDPTWDDGNIYYAEE